MSGLEQDTNLVRGIAAHSGLSPAAIAREIGVAKTTINRPYNGSATTRLSGPTLQKLKHRFPEFPGWTEEFEQRLPFRGMPNAAEAAKVNDARVLDIPMIDLGRLSGGAIACDDFVSERTERFSLAFVRMFSAASADELMFMHGIGDSMAPTIGEGDLLLIDRSKSSIQINDQIWLLASAGTLMVKRVRLEEERARLLSDNSKIPECVTGIGSLAVIGRVVAVVRKT